MIEFTNHDGRQIAVSVAMLCYICEITAEQLKEAPLGRTAIIMNKTAGGGGFYAREPFAEMSAKWKVALGGKNRLN